MATGSVRVGSFCARRWPPRGGSWSPSWCAVGGPPVGGRHSAAAGLRCCSRGRPRGHSARPGGGTPGGPGGRPLDLRGRWRRRPGSGRRVDGGGRLPVLRRPRRVWERLAWEPLRRAAGSPLGPPVGCRADWPTRGCSPPSCARPGALRGTGGGAPARGWVVRDRRVYRRQRARPHRFAALPGRLGRGLGHPQGMGRRLRPLPRAAVRPPCRDRRLPWAA